MIRRTIKRGLGYAGAAAVFLGMSVTSQATNVLWWDSTPEYGGQAPDALRKAMSDFINDYGDGTTFNSTYVGSETVGTLATHLASNTYDVIVFDATSSTFKFSSEDLNAIKWHYQENSNLLLDGNLYVRSIDFNTSSEFPGINGSTGGLTVNQVHALASRGGGIMIGTDHDCCQTDANQILRALLPDAAFSGNTSPSTDGVFFGPDLLDGLEQVAAADLLAHWSSIPSQGIAPTGEFTDIFGNTVNLSALVEVANFIGGPKNTFISASWAPGSGTTDVDDTTPGGSGSGSVGVPEPGSLGLLGAGLLVFGLRRRMTRASHA